jgi:hypothetical protein
MTRMIFRDELAPRSTLTDLDPLLMNAFNNVNLAAACLLTSTEVATQLGVPKDQWIYPLGGAGTRDSYNCKLQIFQWTPADIRRKSGTGLIITQAHRYHGRSIHAYKYLMCAKTMLICLIFTRKLYHRCHDYQLKTSRCFPIVPKIACHHLGLSITHPHKPITLLGGLTSFGGAGNNYSMHVCICLSDWMSS